jgi:protein TonB
MKKDLFFSLGLHVVAVVLISAPLALLSKPAIPDQIIKVSLMNMPISPITEASAEKPLDIPQAIEEERPEIAVEDPTTRPEAKVDIPEPVKEKPKPKPEKPKDKPQNKLTDAETGAKTQDGRKEGKVDVEATGAGTLFSGGATVDNASFDYPYWFNLTFNKISQNFRNPINTDARIICTVKFTVIRSGKVIEVEVLSSSGFASFDEACVGSIERSNPFPPMPREFRDEIISITVSLGNR